jgi:phosphoketolase
VLFPADFNTAAAVMEAVWQTHGQIWTLVIPKADALPDLFTPDEARQLLTEGGACLDWAGHEAERARIILTAIGAYQLSEVLRAARRLAERGIPHQVNYLLEPGRFRRARSHAEELHMASASALERLFPVETQARLFVTHTRPEPVLGLLDSWHTGPQTRGLGYINQGGTFDTPGMLFANRCSWAHCVAEAARLLNTPREELLSQSETQGLDGLASPHGVIIPGAEPDR